MEWRQGESQAMNNIFPPVQDSSGFSVIAN